MDDQNIPAGLDEFLATPVAQPTAQPSMEASRAPATDSTGAPPGLDAFVQEEMNEEKYGGIGQQAITALEGAARGIAGPLAPLAETKLLGVKEEDIRGRAETNPITHGVAEAGTMVGGLLTGVGEGALLAKAGQAAVEAANLGKAASFGAKVGSAAVRNAAETALYQLGDEASKMILKDPGYSAESAVAHIGMAGLLGGAAGGLFGTGGALWDATLGPKLDGFLGAVRGHLDGDGLLKTPDIDAAAQSLGVELSPEMRAAISGNPKAGQMFNELREVQHPNITKQLAEFEANVNNGVMKAFKHTPEDIANYSEAEGGTKAMNIFKQEMKERYEPIAKEFEEVTEKFKDAAINAGEKSTLADKIVTMAQEKGYMGVDIPQQKVINKALELLPNINTAADVSKVNTILGNMTEGDLQLRRVSRDLRELFLEAQHDAVSAKIGADAPQLMDKYLGARKGYAEFAKTAQQLSDELGLGRFYGYKTFLEKLGSKRSPEQFLRRLSPKGNAEIIDFLGKNFPSTLESIRDNELRQLLKPAVLGAKGDSQINTRILANAIEKGLAGQKERIQFAMPPEALQKLGSAQKLMESIPGMKSSGTAGWHQRLTRTMAPSAMAGVATILGHNPVAGWLTGEAARFMSREAPDAMKLAMLKFMGSDQPIKAPAFKAMVEFIDNSIKGQNAVNKAVQGVFKSGAQVIMGDSMPTEKQREKLDKTVQDLQENPDTMLNLAQGQTGHYLPDAQAALTQTSVNALQYLQTLKPSDAQHAALDMPMPPNASQKARYNRALDIAIKPLVVMDAVKTGIVTKNDLIDLKTMYPSLYQGMATKLVTGMAEAKSKKETIPYKTRMGLSLFLGQPVDSSMTPMSIQSSMAINSGIAGQQQQATAQQASAPAAKTNKIGKTTNKMTMTPNQSSEAHKLDKR